MSNVPFMSREQLTQLAAEDPTAFQKMLEAAEKVQIEESRNDPNAFAAFILRDEQTGKPIRQAPYHRKIQDIVTEHNRIVVWGHVGLGKCVVGDTVFVLECGTPITLDELRLIYVPGLTRVLTLDESSGSILPVAVQDISYNGYTPTVKITTDYGHACTTNTGHPYYVRRGKDEGWLYAQHVRPGDVVFTTPPLFESSASSLVEDDARAIGLLLNLLTANGKATPSKTAGQLSFNLRGTQSLRTETVILAAEVAAKLGWKTHVEHKGSGDITGVSFEGAERFMRRVGMETTLAGQSSGRWGILPPALLGSSMASARAFVDGLTVGRVSLSDSRAINNIGTFGNASTNKAVHWMLLKAGYEHRHSDKSFRLGRTATQEVISRLASTRPGYYQELLKHIATHTQAVPLVGATKDPRAWVPTRVRSVEPSGMQRVFAVETDAPHTHLTDGIYTHNTQQLSIARVIWEIGRNHNLRVVIVQATIGLAEGIVTSLKDHIEHNERVHKVFPDLRPGASWTTTQFTVERDGNLKDPTVIAVGAEGNVLGRRIDLLILDDALTLENTRLESRRMSFMRWLQSTLFTRLEPGSKVVFIGNAWDVDDAMHYYSKVKTWRAFKFPVRDPKTKRPLWPARWPQSRIDDFIETSPLEAARALDCDATSDLGSRFKLSAMIAAVNAGRGLFKHMNRIETYSQLPSGWVTASGVDLGLKKEVGADYTAITTWAMAPDRRKYLINIERARYSYEEIITAIIDTHIQYNSTIYVESVAAQRFIVDAIQSEHPNIPISHFFTGGKGGFQNKHSSEFGIEAIARDLARDQIVVLATEGSKDDSFEGIDPLVAIFFSECRAYTAGSGHHTGDILMSAWIGHQALVVVTASHNFGNVEVRTVQAADGAYEVEEEEEPVARSTTQLRALAMQELFEDLLAPKW